MCVRLYVVAKMVKLMLSFLLPPQTNKQKTSRKERQLCKMLLLCLMRILFLETELKS